MQDPTFWNAIWALLSSPFMIVLIVISVMAVSIVEWIEKHR